MKKIFILLLCILPLMLFAQKKKPATEARAEVTIQTTMGKVVVALYNQTPLHRDNFLRQVGRGYYDGLLFHRIIEGFMIQCGDSISRDVPAQEFKNSDGPSKDPLIPAEFRFPELFHRRGVLAAAREGDEYNPTRASSPFEFYLAWGKFYQPKDMKAMQEKVLEREDSTTHVIFPQELIDAYEIDGGIPHLDGSYTVFGEVIKGLDVVGNIQSVKTDSLDRPLKDVRIKKAWISKSL